VARYVCRRQLAADVILALVLASLLYITIAFSSTGFLALWRVKLRGVNHVLCGSSNGHFYVIYRQGSTVYIASINNALGYIEYSKPILRGNYVAVSCAMHKSHIVALVFHFDKYDLIDSYYLVKTRTDSPNHMKMLRIPMPALNKACPPGEGCGTSLGVASNGDTNGVILESSVDDIIKGTRVSKLYIWSYFPDWNGVLTVNVTATQQGNCTVKAGALSIPKGVWLWRQILSLSSPACSPRALVPFNRSIKAAHDYVILDIPAVVKGSRRLVEISISTYGSVEAALIYSSGRLRRPPSSELNSLLIRVEELLERRDITHNSILFQPVLLRRVGQHIFMVIDGDDAPGYGQATILAVADARTSAIEYLRVLWSGRPDGLLVSHNTVYVVTWEWSHYFHYSDTYYLYKFVLVRPLWAPVYTYLLLSTYWHGNPAVLLLLVASITFEKYRSLLKKLSELEAEEPGEGEER